MFDIGFWELILVGIVSLLVLGPERLPGAVRTAALLLRRARNVVATVRAEIERELALEEVKASLERGGLKSLEQELRRPVVPTQTTAHEPTRLGQSTADDDST